MNTETGVLAVSFGTTVDEARHSCVEPVEGALARRCAPLPFFRAYTSGVVRRRLGERGIVIPSPEEALEEMARRGVTRAAVQPTHLLAGFEYDKLAAVVDRARPRFRELRLGRPLLWDTQGVEALAQVLSARFPREEGGCVALMGHGTRHPANLVYPALQGVLSRMGRHDLLVGTVEGSPELTQLLPMLEGLGARRVTLAPLLLVAGEHACEDMAGPSPESWRGQLEARGLEVRCLLEGLGALEAVQELYCRRLEELLW